MRYINKSDLLVVARNMGFLMIGIGVLCLVPIIADLIYLEFNAIIFIIFALISIFLGLIFVEALKKYDVNKMRLKHAMMVSTLTWVWASFICGSILHFITGLSMIDSIFECMSALTGSGITIYPDVEILPYSILFFRALQQWVGGLGIIVMIIFAISKPGVVSSKLYLSEAREDRIKPSIKTTIEHTLKIYLILTIFGIILYLLVGMPIFDSVCNTFCIISTGGMSVKNANIGFYQNNMIYFVTMIIMILGATSFLVHFKFIRTRGRSLINDVQFRLMIALIAVAFLLIYLTSYIVPMDILFVVVSAITTTGASIQSSTVMGGWPAFSIFIIMVLMLIGGSTGSTVGAIKLMRIIAFFKGIYRNIREIWYPPGSVVPLNRSGEKISENLVEQSGNYIAIYLILILISWSLLCLYGHDTFDSLFFTISMQGNIGLEIGQISQSLDWPLKIAGMFNMLTGRLEIYPVLITLRAIFEIFRR